MKLAILSLCLLLFGGGQSAHPRAVGGSASIDLGEYVQADVNASLLPVLVLEDGTRVRSLSVHAMFIQDLSTFIGECGEHLMVPAGSTETLRMSAIALQAGERLRSYDVTLTLVAGETWGSVDDFEKDVVIAARRHSR